MRDAPCGYGSDFWEMLCRIPEKRERGLRR